MIALAAMVLAAADGSEAAEVVAVDIDMAGAGDGSASLLRYLSWVRRADSAVSQALTGVLGRLDRKSYLAWMIPFL
jgi:hypothetical protein